MTNRNYMKINAKILKFFKDREVSNTEIANSYGGSSQNIWNILNKENGKIPLDFLIWIAENYPELNINELLRSEREGSIVSEPYVIYDKKPATKQEILKEIEIILDKYL